MQLPLIASIYLQQPTESQDISMWQHMAEALHQSVLRVTALLVSVLPGLLAFVVSVALMCLLGALCSFALRRILTWCHFDERLQKGRASGVAEWSPGHAPTALAGRITFWVFVLLGIVIGILSLDASYANGASISASLLPYLSRYVGAALLLIVGNIIARFLARSVLIGAVNYQLQYARFLSIGIKWLVLVLTAAMALDHLQIGGTIVELAFGVLFGGIVLTLSLAVGLGSRDLVMRSLERTAERTDFGAKQTDTQPTVTEKLRHF
jgi:hypothetical protein